jgi:hypothetical protein
MRGLVLALVPVLLMGGGAVASVADGHGGETAADRPACTGLTDGNVEVRTVAGAEVFLPECVAIDNGGQATFENADDPRVHDPGDTGLDHREDPGDAGCFSTRSDAGGNLGPGDTYAVELTFDEAEEELYRSAASYDGEPIPDDPFLSPDTDEPCPDEAWRFTDDGNVLVDVVCHLHTHQDAASGWILIDL